MPLTTRHQRGFSLIESLIAMVIFSVGVLSLVAAQAAAKQYSVDAQLHAEAMHHASGLIAQMRLADPSTVATQYSSPAGLAYVAWRDQLGGAERGLPGAAALPPQVSIVGTTVSVQIFWVGMSQRTRRQLSLVTEL